MTTLRSFDVVQHLTALRRFARTLTRSEAEADDLVQQALVHALERRGSYDSRRNLKTWLFAVMHSTFLDGLRRRRAEARRDDRLSVLFEDEVATPAQDAAVRLAQIRRAFETLPEEQRQALHLVAVEGLPYQEAAAVLGVPIGTLMSRIGRARAALRAMESEAPKAASSSNPTLRIVGGRDDTR